LKVGSQQFEGYDNVISLNILDFQDNGMHKFKYQGTQVLMFL